LKIFVCSFSEEGDQLSQWRGYCPSGYGFSIGFDYVQLKKHMERQNFILAKCIYKENEQKRRIDQYVKEAVEPRLSCLNEENYTERIGKSIFELFHVLPILKHDSFHEEREWRLISLFEPAGARVRFRAGRTTLIPYYEFELTDGKTEGQTLPVESIIVGPTPNAAESLHAIKALLEQEGMTDKVKVIASRIPYREV